ncbi:MAG: DUF1080 domain-containing protein [Candidatus Omnitrophica bacterium]|nr:DUF1080 domain-containing protein [Candidatus Omnitrophota bacterium]
MQRFTVKFLSPALLVWFAFVGSANAKEKDLRVYDGQFCWRTSPEHMVGAEYPGVVLDPDVAKNFRKEVLDYPESGAEIILFSLQKPGEKFFAPDGKSTSKDKAALLAKQVEAIRYFSGTPLITLFDPDPSCRLESEEAYVEAAKWVIEALREELGFMVCISDRCDDPGWGRGSPGLYDIGLVEEIAGAIEEASPGRIVVAGGDSPDVLEALEWECPNVGALIRNDSKFEFGQGVLSFGKKPIIEVVNYKNATEEDIHKAWARVREDAKYAWVLSTDLDKPDPEMLEFLRKATNSFQIERSEAVPPDPDDTASLMEGEKAEGFVSLFNEKNLNGWVANSDEANFGVHDDYISVDKKSGGWLRSYYPYDDFVFRCQYQIKEGQNSGLHIRAPLNGRNSRVGFEFQILGQPIDAKPEISGNGSIYDVKAPDEMRMKPYGEWNDVEIRCEGPHLRIVWNGAVVHDIDYGDYERMEHRKQSGYIGLQDHDGSVKFRKIRIKPLGKDPHHS